MKMMHHINLVSLRNWIKMGPAVACLLLSIYVSLDRLYPLLARFEGGRSFITILTAVHGRSCGTN